MSGFGLKGEGTLDFEMRCPMVSAPYISLNLPISPCTWDSERRSSVVSVAVALLRRNCSGTWGDVGEMW